MGGSLAKRAQANRKPVVCALLLVAVAAVFGQTLWHDFVLIDDGVFVLDSPQVLAGLTWKGVVWAFTSGGYGEWTPLASLSHMLDCQLFGPSPGPHHATNVLLHAISAVLLFLALARMTGQRAVPDTDGTLVAKPASDADRASYRRTVPHPLSGYPAQVSGARAAEGRAERDNTASAKPASDAHRAQASGARAAEGRPERNNTASAIILCAWVAAVFAVHPLRAESVAWIAERRDVLSGCFFMLTLWCYARYVEAPSRRRYLAVAGVFALALMSKPIVVTTPFVLLLLDYWPLGRFMTGAGAGWRLLREKLPLVALSAATCVIVLLTHATQQVGTRFVLRPLPTRLVDAIAGYGAYVLGAFWPANLSPYYPIETSGPTATSIAVGVAMLLVTAAACIFWRRTPPYLLVGLLWFVGMLVPVIGLLQIADAAHADRYTYLSEIGLAIAVAWGVANLGLWQRAGQEGTAGSRLLVTAAFVPVVVLAVLGYRQTAFWRNDETLWTRAIDCDPDNLIARYLLGRYFVREGKTEQGIAELRRAIASYSLKEYMLSDAHALLARTLSEEGQTAEGLQHYQQAVDIDPTSDMARGRLARALDAAGRHAEAADQWREAIRLIPTGPARSLTEAIPDLVAAARKSLAAALLSAGRADEAIVECQTILQTRPGQADVLELLGEALLARGDVEAAIPRFEEVLVSEPVNVEVHMRLAAALSERGRAAEALAHLDAAIRLEAQPVAMQQAAWLRATSVEPAVRDGVLAVELAKRSIEYRPSDPRGFDALGAALAETGDFVAALDAASRARDLAQSAGESKLAAAIGARIESYRRGEAIREEGLRLEATGLR